MQAGQSRSPRRVVIVEDSGIIRTRIAAALAALPGVRLIGHAEDVAPAIELIERTRPDAVVLDLSLPSGSGMRVLEHIKQQRPTLVVVVLTNHVTPEYRQEALALGADAFLDKSREFEQVAEALELSAPMAEEMRGFLLGDEELFNALVDMSADAIAVTDVRGTFLDVNEGVTRLFGYDAEDLIGRSVLELIPEGYRAVVAERMRTEADEPYEGTVLTKDGRPVEVRWTSRMCVLKGQRVRLTALHDLTSRHAAERQSRLQAAALNATANPMIITDRTGRIEWVNPAWQAVNGYTAAEVIGSNPRVLKSGAQDEIFYRALWDTILAGGVWSGMMVNRTRSGTFVLVEGTITPVTTPEGQVTHFIGVMKDVTERERARTRERALEADLRRTEKFEALGRVTAAVAHDFNNILSLISTLGALVRTDLDAGHPAVTDLLDIEDAVKRGRALAHQLLTFGVTPAGERQTVVLGEAVRAVEPLLRTALGSRIALHTRFAVNGQRVGLQGGTLDQVLLNLVLNARDAMPEGGTVDIVTDIVEREGCPASGDPGGPAGRITVTDSGTGMDEATRARIFEPFFTTKGERGTGLGLATVHGIVRQSGGSISVASEVGRGTTFEILLPVAGRGAEV